MAHDRLSLLLSSFSPSSGGPTVSYDFASSSAVSMPIGYNSLHLAVEQDRLSVISMLWSQQATIFAQRFCGATALHIAPARGNAAATKLLLGAAATVCCIGGRETGEATISSLSASRDIGGAAARHLAAADGEGDVVAAWLMCRSPAYLDPRFSPEDRQPPNTVEMKTSQLISNPNAIDAKCQTPLYRAAVAGCEAAVQMLLDAGADVHVKSTSGCMALHVAGCVVHERIVALLLESGAEVHRPVRV